MNNLDDRLLVHAYLKAKELNLESEFISLLEKELNKRGLIVSDDLNQLVFFHKSNNKKLVKLRMK
ncbi:sporulation histidine kinase inhibitor Sda [Pseudogracilibacillus sp. SE30717A]|uniref:sporulation histidine kinase inhibitor Sda n=1 Tax=Pseudogracilibacillus sp. SE30717A TaxID=3098293 RepID=UPI00300E2EC8